MLGGVMSVSMVDGVPAEGGYCPLPYEGLGGLPIAGTVRP